MTVLTNTHPIPCLVIILAVTGLNIIVTADNGTISIEDSYIALQNEMFNRPVIKNKLPLGATGKFTISMSFTPFQITSVDEIGQLVKISSLVTLFWNYSQLTWNRWDYHNHASLFVDSSSVWLPQVAMPKSGSDPWVVIPDVIELYEVFFRAQCPTRITTLCELDLTYFPFDSHNCSLSFIETNKYNIEPAELWMYVETISLSKFFSTNSEWILKEYSCKSQIETNGHGYVDCWYTMERRSKFYVIGVIFPILVIAFMTHFVFVIPAESGEKMSFIVSLFVSMAIFINYVNDIIPRSMARIPLIVLYLAIVLGNMAVCMLATFLVIRRYHAHLERKQMHTEDGVNRSEMNVKSVDGKIQTKDSAATKSFISLNRAEPLNHDISLGHDHIGDRKDVATRASGSKAFYNWFANLTHTQLDNFFFVLSFGISFLTCLIIATY